MNIIPRKYYLDEILEDFVSSKGKDIMKCDIYEDNGIYNIEVDVPGFEKKDINIECKDGYLTVSVKKEEKQESDNKNYIRKERFYGEYTRTFYLGELDTDRIEAKFNNGTLHITVPKEEKQINKRVIEISD